MALGSYEAASAAQEWHVLDEGRFGLTGLTAKEIVKNYDYRFAKKERVGRPTYDALRLGAKGGICPLCGVRQVKTLDHYLPKQRFAALAVMPRNLIPCCSDCNFLKKERLALSAAEQTLHPYYDDVENTPWLRAEVRHGASAGLEYGVHDFGGAPPLMQQRLQKHFDVFELGELYAVMANEELGFIRQDLIDLFDEGGENQVRASLEDDAASCRAYRVNHWKTAMYTALAGDAWFHAEGFRA